MELFQGSSGLAPFGRLLRCGIAVHHSVAVAAGKAEWTDFADDSRRLWVADENRKWMARSAATVVVPWCCEPGSPGSSQTHPGSFDVGVGAGFADAAARRRKRECGQAFDALRPQEAFEFQGEDVCHEGFGLCGWGAWRCTTITTQPAPPELLVCQAQLHGHAEGYRVPGFGDLGFIGWKWGGGRVFEVQTTTWNGFAQHRDVHGSCRARSWDDLCQTPPSGWPSRRGFHWLHLRCLPWRGRSRCSECSCVYLCLVPAIFNVLNIARTWLAWRLGQLLFWPWACACRAPWASIDFAKCLYLRTCQLQPMDSHFMSLSQPEQKHIHAVVSFPLSQSLAACLFQFNSLIYMHVVSARAKSKWRRCHRCTQDSTSEGVTADNTDAALLVFGIYTESLLFTTFDTTYLNSLN